MKTFLSTPAKMITVLNSNITHYLYSHLKRTYASYFFSIGVEGYGFNSHGHV